MFPLLNILAPYGFSHIIERDFPGVGLQAGYEVAVSSLFMAREKQEG
jgi:hypothetical protein